MNGPSKIQTNGIDVALQDQTTPVVIVKFSKLSEQTTLAAVTAIDINTITVADATGIVAGRYISIFSAADVRFYTGTVVSVASEVLTMDTPLDFVFPVGAAVDSGITDMSVDGSSTTQIFGLRGSGAPPGIRLDFDVTRIIFSCLASSAIDLALFANITALEKGLVLRKKDGVYNNVFNVKSNGDIAGIMYDFNAQAATNPAQGQDGFISRLTFGGQSKIGVVQRLKIGEDLQVLIQDNLTGISKLEIIAEGHIVQD